MAIYSDDGTLANAPELKKFYELVFKATELTGFTLLLLLTLFYLSINLLTLTSRFAGRDFRLSAQLKPLVERAGFERVHHQGAKVPLGPWAADRKQKEMGAYVLLSAETGFEAFGIQVFTNVLKMDVDEAQNLIRETLKQAKSRKIHSYTMQ